MVFIGLENSIYYWLLYSTVICIHCLQIYEPENHNRHIRAQ